MDVLHTNDNGICTTLLACRLCGKMVRATGRTREESSRAAAEELVRHTLDKHVSWVDLMEAGLV